MRAKIPRDLLWKSAVLAAAASGSTARAQQAADAVPDPAMAPPPIVAAPPPIVAPPPPPPRPGPRKPSLFFRLHGKAEEFNRPPLGTDVYNVNNVQVANGDAARLILHEYDFIDGTSQLNDRGRYRAAWIGRQLGRVPAPVFVEATPDEPGLDEARRSSVELALSGGPMPLLPGMVRVGRPNARGFLGTEAELINFNRLGNIEAKGPPIGSSAGPGPFAGGAAGSTPGFGR